MSRPILFTYWRSSCSWRVRIALHIKGIDFENRPVNLVTKDGEAVDECFKLNPARQVPVFVDNGNVFTESLAIIEYIEETFPGRSLLPKDPVQRAHARAIALHIACSCQPLQNLRVQQKLNKEEDGKGPKWAAFWLTQTLGELEKMLEKTAGRYSVGDEVTIADLCLPSILYNARRYAVDLTPLPTLRRVDEELSKIPAFELSHPDKQPDAPKA